MNIRNIIFVVFLTFCRILANAQFVDIPSPSLNNSYELSLNEDLYTGKANFSVPITSIKLGDKQFPISLTYIGGNGVKVTERPGTVGLAWNLEPNGYVQRAINGRPDEFQLFANKYNETFRFIGNGYTSYTRRLSQESLPKTYTYFDGFSELNKSNWNSATNVQQYLVKWGDDNELSTTQPGAARADYSNILEENKTPKPDLAPDIFHFKFGGYSGKFFLGHTGEWIVISDNNITYQISVAFTQEQLQNYNTSNNGEKFYLTIPPYIKEIKMLSSDGMILTFGGEEKFIEYSVASKFSDGSGTSASPYFGNYKYNRIPSAWKIVSIQDNNTSEKIVFQYRQNPTFTSSNNPKGITPSIAFGLFYTTAEWYDDFQYSGSRITFWQDQTAVSRVFHMEKILEKIIHSNGTTVEFNLENLPQIWNGHTIDSYNLRISSYPDTLITRSKPESFYPLTVTGIDVKSGTTSQSYRLIYFDKAEERLKLQKVVAMSMDATAEKVLYEFHYNNKLMPDYESREKDHWGFYNGKDLFKGKALNARTSADSLIKYPATRIPDTALNKAEILEKVVDQLGQTIQFEYEPNSFSRIYSLETGTFKDSIGFGGGVRLKSILRYDSRDTLIKSYSYTDGILSRNIPTYISLLEDGARKLNNNSDLPHIYEGAGVYYTQVSERMENGGVKEYHYSNYGNGFKDEKSNVYDLINFPAAFIDNSFKRGKLIRLFYYNDKQSLVRKEYYKYEHDYPVLDKVEYRALFTAYDNLYVTISQKLYSDLIREQKTVTFSGKDSSEEFTKYEYDRFNNIKREVSVSSYQDSLEINTKYINDYTYSGSIPTSYSSMRARHMFNQPIEVYEKKAGKVINGKIFEFALRNSVVVPANEYILSSETPLQSFSISTLGSNGIIKNGSYKLTKEITNTDRYGNVLEVKSFGGAPVSYIWGNSGQYPVITVRNATYAEISAILGQTAINNLSSMTVSDADVIAATNTLRSHSNLRKAEVIGYTYKNLVGMTSTSDARGVTEYYEYDEYYRPKSVLDNEKNVIKDYQYYSPAPIYYSAARSASFQKTGCPIDYDGTQVVYSVPAGRYTSSISEADANQKAQSDLNNNGQNYANTNGTCVSTALTFYVRNSTKGTVSITLTRTDIPGGTTQRYSVPAGNTAFAIPNIPRGRYTINGNIVGATGDFLWRMNCGESAAGNLFMFSVMISRTDCNSMDILNN